MKPAISRRRIHVPRDNFCDFDIDGITGPALYRFAVQGQPKHHVYIGKTEKNVADRIWDDHCKKPWFRRVESMTVQLYNRDPADLVELGQDEAYLIRKYQPRYNKQYKNHLCLRHLPKSPVYLENSQCPTCGWWHLSLDRGWWPHKDPRR